jgi:hypothetical protein
MHEKARGYSSGTHLKGTICRGRILERAVLNVPKVEGTLEGVDADCSIGSENGRRRHLLNA